MQDWLQRLLSAAALGSARAAAAAATAAAAGAARGEGEGAGAGRESVSPCDRWVSCSAQLRPAIRSQLTALPACPCTFPANVFYYNKIWDPKHAR